MYICIHIYVYIYIYSPTQGTVPTEKPKRILNTPRGAQLAKKNICEGGPKLQNNVFFESPYRAPACGRRTYKGGGRRPSAAAPLCRFLLQCFPSHLVTLVSYLYFPYSSSHSNHLLPVGHLKNNYSLKF